VEARREIVIAGGRRQRQGGGDCCAAAGMVVGVEGEGPCQVVEGGRAIAHRLVGAGDTTVQSGAVRVVGQARLQHCHRVGGAIVGEQAARQHARHLYLPGRAQLLEIEAFEQLAGLGVTTDRHQRPAQGGDVGGVIGAQLHGLPEVAEGLAVLLQGELAAAKHEVASRPAGIRLHHGLKVLDSLRETALLIELETGAPVGGGRSGCQYNSHRHGDGDDESARRDHVPSPVARWCQIRSSE
jgi:hypothetical protein